MGYLMGRDYSGQGYIRVSGKLIKINEMLEDLDRVDVEPMFLLVRGSGTRIIV